jgi:ATP-dependent RNA helicase RhlE
MSFNSLGLSSSLLKAVAGLDYTQATPIQEQAIPAILAKKDVLGIAHTGSGKTVSYVLPMLMNLQGKQAKSRHINALVLVPTRELAVQVNDVFKEFGNVMEQRVKSLAVYGGVSINPQMMQLQGVHVLVATPGRLLELVEKNAVQLSETEVLVLDEADKMLNLGFKEEVDEVIALLPKVRQNLLFSATLNEDVHAINQKLLHLPVVINIDVQLRRKLS